MSTNAKVKTDFGSYAFGASGLYGTGGDYNHGDARSTLQKLSSDEFRFSMLANYFFKQSNASFIEFGTDFNYVFPLTPKPGVYPVLGLGYSIMKLNNVIEKPTGIDILPDDYAGDSEDNLNFDLGTGCEYYFIPSFRGFAEVKYRYVKNYDRTLFQVGVAYIWQTTNWLLTKHTDMRKSLFAVIATVYVAMTPGGCQIYGLIKDATDKEERKTIMKDGKEYVGRVEMPNVNTKRLLVVVKDGQKTVVEAKNIASLAVWKKAHPGRKHTLKYLPSEFLRKKMHKPLWMAVIVTGPYVEFYTCSPDYSIPSSGYPKITNVQNGSIEHLALKKGGKIPKTISVSDISKRQKCKLLLEYLNDDAALMKKINNQDIRPDDFETIAEIYHP